MNNINFNSSINNNLIEKNEKNIPNSSNPLDLQKNFLSLLIAQIKNQDPTDPIKNTELTSQLAQIHTAGGIERLNNTVGSFSNKINSHQKIQISSLIGHHVMIPNTQIIYTKNNDTRFGVQLIKDATSLEIQIKDKNDKVIHVLKRNNIKSGIYSFNWNGKNMNNDTVQSGKYKILVIAKNKDQDVPTESLSEGLVHSIITSSNDPIINLGEQGNTTLSKIREILK